MDFGILGEAELCCGSTLLRMGDREGFKRMARANLDSLKKLGVKTVVTGCSGCYSVLKEEYPELEDLPFEVKHITEMLASLVKEGRADPQGEVAMKVTYHDPCHLGRYCEVFDAPREVLEAIPGLELAEMQRSREKGWCCGAGAGVRTAFPEFAAWSAGERLYEAKETGAEAVATACPFCEQNLRAAADGFEVLSVVDLLARSLGRGSKRTCSAGTPGRGGCSEMAQRVIDKTVGKTIAAVLEEVRGVVGEDWVSDGPAILIGYSKDNSFEAAKKPHLVAMPANTAPRFRTWCASPAATVWACSPPPPP